MWYTIPCVLKPIHNGFDQFKGIGYLKMKTIIKVIFTRPQTVSNL